jgi:cell fate (sporulation/competence/biofilm development) regulator YlbF (YheA/YmcA/DUF963 family)
MLKNSVQKIAYNKKVFGDEINYHLYEICIYCLKHPNMKINEINKNLFELFIQRYDLENELDFKFTNSRLHFIKKAIFDYHNVYIQIADENTGDFDEKELDRYVTNLSKINETDYNCQKRHYNFGVELYKQFAKIINGFSEMQNNFVQEKEESKQFDENDVNKSLRIRNSELQKEVNRLRKTDDYILARLGELHDCIIANNPIKPYKSTYTKKNSSKTLLVTLSDVHFGQKIIGDHGKINYDADITEHRFDEYAGHVVELVKNQNIDRVVVCCLGDMISGNIHHSLVGETDERYKIATEQSYRVAELTAKFIEKIAENTNQVDYYCVQGNHERLCKTKDENSEYSTHTVTFLYCLKTMLKNMENVNFCNDVSEQKKLGNLDRQIFSIYGKTFEIAHGDNDKNSYKGVSASESRNGEIVDFRLLGHKHNTDLTQFGRNTTITTGCFGGQDRYGKNFGAWKSSQIMLLLTKGHNGYALIEHIF